MKIKAARKGGFDLFALPLSFKYRAAFGWL